MLIETVAASGAVLVCRKGRFASLKRLRIHGWYFLIASVLLQSLLSYDIIPAAFHYAAIISSYILILLCLLLNLRRFSIKLATGGMLLNFLVIAANDGYMPVWLKAMAFAGYDTSKLTTTVLDTFHALITESTRLSFLADIIPIPEPYPFPQILSIGDLLIMAGVFLFFQDLKPRPPLPHQPHQPHQPLRTRQAAKPHQPQPHQMSDPPPNSGQQH